MRHIKQSIIYLCRVGLQYIVRFKTILIIISSVVSEQLPQLSQNIRGPLGKKFDFGNSGSLSGHRIGLIHPLSFESLCISNGVSASGATLVHLPNIPESESRFKFVERTWSHVMADTSLSLLISNPASLHSASPVAENLSIPTIASYGPRLRHVYDARLIDPSSGIFGNSTEIQYPEGTLQIPSGPANKVGHRVSNERANPSLPRSAKAVSILKSLIERNDFEEKYLNDLGSSSEFKLLFGTRDDVTVVKPLLLSAQGHRERLFSLAVEFDTDRQVLIALEDSESPHASLEWTEAALSAGAHVILESDSSANQKGDFMSRILAQLTSDTVGTSVSHIVASPSLLMQLFSEVLNNFADGTTTRRLLKTANIQKILVAETWSTACVRRMDTLNEDDKYPLYGKDGFLELHLINFAKEIFGNQVEVSRIVSLVETGPILRSSSSSPGYSALSLMKNTGYELTLEETTNALSVSPTSLSSFANQLVSNYLTKEQIQMDNQIAGDENNSLMSTDLTVDPENLQLRGSLLVNPVEEAATDVFTRLKRWKSPTEMAYMPEGFMKKVPITTFEWANFHKHKRFWKRGNKG